MTTGFQGTGTTNAAANTPAGGWYVARLGKVGVVALTATSTTQIDLAWPDVHYCEGYSVERSLDGLTGWAEIATPTLATYSDTGRTVGTRYYYRVRARDYGAYGAYSEIVDTYTLPAKVGVVTPSVISATEIDLDWADVTSATSYYVERSPNGTTGWTHLTPDPATSAFNNTGLTTGTQYFYRVSAVNPGGTGASSDVVNATTS